MKIFLIKMPFNRITMVVFSWFFSPAMILAQPTIYPSPGGLAPSAEYQVKVNGQDVFVYASPVPAAWCSFDMDQPVEITIKANRDIKWVDIRPLSSRIKPRFKDSTISFRVTKPSQLSIELNGSLKMPLFIFANPPEVNKPGKNDPEVIYFEAGKIHYPGIIQVKTNQTVYIEGGAVVIGVVEANNAKHIRIAGRGVLDGTYNHMFSESIVKTKNPGVIAANKTMGEYHRFLEFKDCEDVRIEGIILHNSTSWQIVPFNCNKVNISNIKIVSDQASDDGIDIVHSKNVVVRNSFIRTKDDCIAVKSYVSDPPGANVDSVLVEKCVFWNALWGNGLEIGFELNSAEIKNITFRNSDIIHVEAGAVFSIHNAGTSNVHNILYDDIRVEDARQKLFDLAIFRSRYSVDGTTDEKEKVRLNLNGAWDGVLSIPANEKDAHAVYRGTIKNVVFRNIKIVDGLFPYSIFYGFNADKNISNIVIENLRVHGKKITALQDARFYAENTDRIIIR
ncbi:MAG: glycosyl hydrolase family 28 protein [Ferruginibacter sp.]